MAQGYNFHSLRAVRNWIKVSWRIHDSWLMNKEYFWHSLYLSNSGACFLYRDKKKRNPFPFHNYLAMCLFPRVKVECGNHTTSYASPGSSGISGFEGIQKSSHHLSQVNSNYRGTAVNHCQDWTSWSGLKQEDHQMMLSCSSAIATNHDTRLPKPFPTILPHALEGTQG